ncbi:MAG: hypothetical protein V5A33_00470 [Halobacteriales archaeon]
MTGRIRASALWGLVAAMLFLVLVQGYEAAVGLSLGAAAKLAVALVVFAAGSAAAGVVDRWLVVRAG